MHKLPPSIDESKLQHNERQIAKGIDDNLTSLYICVDDFSHTLALFDWCVSKHHSSANDEHKHLSQWKKIAARNGAIVLYQFGEVLAATKSLALSCATMKQEIGRAALSAVEVEFRNAFPRIARIRHVGAHFAELMSTPKKVKQNSTIRPVKTEYLNLKSKGIMMSECIFNRRYIVTHEGDLLDYELSSNSLNLLLKVEADVYRAFADFFRSFPAWP